MIIDVKEYLLNKIGHTSWYGESNHDSLSSANLAKVDSLLYEVEQLREELISLLNEHIVYNKGNGSSEQLHKQAKTIRAKHIIEEITHSTLNSLWGDE